MSNIVVTAVAGVVGLILFVVMLVIIVASRQRFSSCGVDQPGASEEANSIPASYLGFYRRAGAEYGIPWNVLAGIGKVESDHGRDNSSGVHSGENYAGAGGPMQFLQATWNTFGVDGNDDGRRDRYDPADAIPGAANYLKHNHADRGGAKLRKAIWFYNHSWAYVDLVLLWAKRYGANDFSPDADAGVDIGGAAGCGFDSGTDPSIAGPFAQRVIAYAKKWLGLPYQFGGGTFSGPTVGDNSNGSGKPGFDCSGLVVYSFYQASKGKIKLPRTTYDQVDVGHRIAASQMQPGDLLFPNEHHVGIYLGGGKFIEAPHTGAVVRISPIAGRGFFAAVHIDTPGGDQ
ncbi:Peptidoglycan endopeptidase RipA precursor [Actinomadura rubteroloni]|uniref:Peptidoglycan endopeptidase RipA n=1 Tax=Actinomadura rubteroloni TaxID=1926885 RepID=A0A2P4UL07_9ACTN|nr:NlpC/P60 family protein [Actinomadura rubteroloni]POM25747.1 Peptidoglycan endopeptidase RipA precursor [Actinomadura rubteroloni]